MAGWWNMTIWRTIVCDDTWTNSFRYLRCGWCDGKYSLRLRLTFSCWNRFNLIVESRQLNRIGIMPEPKMFAAQKFWNHHLHAPQHTEAYTLWAPVTTQFFITYLSINVGLRDKRVAHRVCLTVLRKMIRYDGSCEILNGNIRFHNWERNGVCERVWLD